jgi:predicted DNA-binding protein (MmcQ/YjbR family)
VAKSNPVLTKMREICLSLPDTKETLTWGQPHFRVGEKIFAGCSEEKGKPVIGFKLEMEHADEVIKDPRFRRAPYVGHKGWVSMDASAVRDWDEVRPYILESYRLIAPKKSWAKLQVGGTVAGEGEAPFIRRTGKLGARRARGVKAR